MGFCARATTYALQSTSLHTSNDSFLQRVAVIVRSPNKPVVQDLKNRGVEILVCADYNKATHAELMQLLAGTDVLIATVHAYVLDAQRPLFAAAKEAGVKRVVPDDFSAHTPPGVMLMADKVGSLSLSDLPAANKSIIETCYP